jgi:hypothetical protein
VAYCQKTRLKTQKERFKMPKSSLTPKEQAELGRLLTIVGEQDEGFIPDVAYRPIHKLVPWPAVEVLVYDEDGRFLLSHRNDDFVGWHIPGGFIKPNEDYQAACNRNVRKEKIVNEVTDLRLLSSHIWLKGEHPFGFPVSLTIACKAVGEVVERDDLKWFSEIPTDIIPQVHPKLLKHFQEWARMYMKGTRPNYARIIE